LDLGFSGAKSEEQAMPLISKSRRLLSIGRTIRKGGKIE
jgi:hypothetical protein